MTFEMENLREIESDLIFIRIRLQKNATRKKNTIRIKLDMTSHLDRTKTTQETQNVFSASENCRMSL